MLVVIYNMVSEVILDVSIRLIFKIKFEIDISFLIFSFFWSLFLVNVVNVKVKLVIEKVIVILFNCYLNLFIRGWLNKF